ncbi:MAG: orotidine 5'-phosphate decarboxylase [Candidatus Helarchaeota archaeon]|nr:orotidine 5'-phosphate decarboxylase [Candidatus Helarchaeota archaeon]
MVLNLDIRRKDFLPNKFPFPPGENRGSFLKKVIEATAEYFAIIKVNYQFIADVSEDRIKSLIEVIKEKGCIPWVDYKLGDIGSSNKHALYNLNKMGFEGITIHQIIGYEEGVKNILEDAEKYKMTVISLAFMSHKGSDDYFNIELHDGRKLYQKIIDDGIIWGIDGFVIGATVKNKIMKDILEKFPKNKKYFILLPGFGAQRGNYPVLKLFNEYNNIIPLPANGREIIYAWLNYPEPFPKACSLTAKRFKDSVQKHYKL